MSGISLFSGKQDGWITACSDCVIVLDRVGCRPRGRPLLSIKNLNEMKSGIIYAQFPANFSWDFMQLLFLRCMKQNAWFFRVKRTWFFCTIRVADGLYLVQLLKLHRKIYNNGESSENICYWLPGGYEALSRANCDEFRVNVASARGPRTGL